MMNLSRWLGLVLSPSVNSRRRTVHASRRVSPYVEALENRALLSNGSLVAIELTEVAGSQFEEVTFEFQLASGRATFTEFGLFSFDTDGTVGGIALGEAGFEEAVLASQNREALMVGGVATGSAVNRTFVGGTRLGVYFRHEMVTTSTSDHVSLLSTSQETFQVGWEEASPIFSLVGPASPRWFDDAVLMISAVDRVFNDRISLDPIADQAILEQRDFELPISVGLSSRDQDLLRFQLDEAPDGAALDAETGLFTWTPTADQGPGSYEVTVRVFDSTDPSFFDTETFTIVVVDAENLASARLTMFVNSDPVDLPANIGVQSNGSVAQALTLEGNGEFLFDPLTPVTLGEFFEIWRTNAGLAGNNPDAEFNGNQLFDNAANATSTVQMFVNGQINRDFDNYVVQSDDEIVIVYGSNPVVSMNTNFGSMVIELFPDQTPITVNNFLNYINGTTQNGGNYDGTFFHRSSTNFVIQAGGFTTPTETFTNISQFGNVLTDPEIMNEPGLSNVRGTIAMAKRGTDAAPMPDSANSQFFINLNDNNTFLDTSNGGFTVFGQVLDMTTADQIADLPVDDSNPSPFNELPVSNTNQLAVIQSFTGQGNLTGVKFQDTNQNGVQDSGEAGIAGVTIYIDANNNGVFDSGEISTTTDANGQFLLQATPGSYTVRAEVSNGAAQTVPTNPDRYMVDVVLGRVIDDLLFGEF